VPQHAPLLKPDGQIAFGSTHFCDLVGIKYDKVAGLSCFDFVVPEDMNAARELFKANRIPHKNALRSAFNDLMEPKFGLISKSLR